MSHFQKKNAAKHYFEIYEKYRKLYDKIVVLYQFGHFYEMFGVDNENEQIGNIYQVTKELGIRDTRCSKKILQNSRKNPQQAGFPSQSLPVYIHKLVELGYTVVVYNQSEDPNSSGPKSKKIRKLDKIVSKGTYINNNIQEDDTKNAVFIYIEEHSNDDIVDISITSINVGTGRTLCYPIIDKKSESIYNASKILHTLSPVEIIITGKNIDYENYKVLLEIDDKILLHSNYKVDKILFRESYQDEFLKKIFPDSGKLSIIEFLDLEHYPNLIISYICLLKFVYDHDETILEKISKPHIRDPTEHVKLSHRTIIQLNLTETDEGKSLFDILNKTSTPMGKRLLRTRLLSPINNVSKLNKRYDEVEVLQTLVEGGTPDKDELYFKIEEHLNKIYDLEKLNRLLFLNKLNPCDISFLDSSYVAVWNIYTLVKNTKLEHYLNKELILDLKKVIKYYRKHIIVSVAAKCTLDNIETRIFRKGLYPDVDKEFERIQLNMKKLQQYKTLFNSTLLNSGEKKKSVKILKTSTEGYFLMVSEKKANILKEFFKDEKLELKKQKSGTKIFSKNIRDISRQICDSKVRLNFLSKKHFTNILKYISDNHYKTLKNVADSVASIDVIKSISKVSSIYKYTRPRIHDSFDGNSYINVEKLRHPIVEQINQKDKFIPYNIQLGGDSESGLLLYGVNGIGKSLCLKSIGILIILAQSGFYVPSDCFTFFPFSHIITKISMTDNIYKSRSFFECEMIEMGKMLEKANPNVLILADELCSGTETIGAISLVGSAIHQLAKNGANFIFTTHLHQLTNIPIVKNLLDDKVKCLHMTIKIGDGRIIYMREFSNGQGPKTYGIEMAKQLGVGDENFIKNATEIRRMLDPNSEKDILTTKQSVYNKDLYMEKCVKCGSKTDLQTHHKKEQKLADKNGMIGPMHKNNKSNLEVLCKKCHQDHHHNHTEASTSETGEHKKSKSKSKTK